MPAQPHNPESRDFEPSLEGWRRIYDWTVLSRQPAALVDEVAFLGQRYSSLLNRYRHARSQRQRQRLVDELQATAEAMQALYDRLDPTHRQAPPFVRPPAVPPATDAGLSAEP